eukprot:c13753_g1_i3.p1 GENE.c13753_g1_i3~~c13753_g1_i3.p1  ORF type:complete len:112 (-),score=3.63 c13753_g1_i3:178-513(-)
MQAVNAALKSRKRRDQEILANLKLGVKFHAQWPTCVHSRMRTTAFGHRKKCRCNCCTSTQKCSCVCFVDVSVNVSVNCNDVFAHSRVQPRIQQAVQHYTNEHHLVHHTLDS